MSAPAAGSRRCSMLGLVLSCVLMMPTLASAQPGIAKPSESSQKRIKFSMDGKPWKNVFSWLIETTNKPLITTHMPQGTFKFEAPPNATYTIPEVIDIINFGLLSNSATQKYYLINGKHVFTLVPANERIDPSLVPTLDRANLVDHGNTELAKLEQPLKAVIASELAPQLEKLMGPFGSVTPIDAGNRVILLDTVGNLKRILSTIDSIEDNKDGLAESFSHKCEWIKAARAADILKGLLGDTSTPMPDPRSRDSRDRDRRSSPAVDDKKIHRISFDTRNNTILVTGPPNKLALAKDIVQKIDVAPTPDAKKYVPGVPTVKTYEIPEGTAETLAEVLSTNYATQPTVKIQAAGKNAIIVLASPEDHLEIAQQIRPDPEKGLTTQLLPVGGVDAAELSLTLTTMYGDPTTGAPYISYQKDQNAIIARGTQNQVADVRESIRAITMSGALGAGSNMRIVTLEQGSAATLAIALERIMSRMRANPVDVITPGEAQPTPQPPRRPQPGPGQPDPDTSSERGEKFLPIAYQPLQDPQRPRPQAPKLPGDAKKPVKITAFGNRLILVSEDPEALALANQLVRLITETPAGEGDFQIIRLKYAIATEAAKVLDEAFNGKQETSSRGRGGSSRGGDNNPLAMLSRFSRGGSAPAAPTDPQQDRIRVVADPGTNSLIVRANPLDMLTIHNLLEKAIDSGYVDSEAALKPHTIKLVYARATEVKAVVEELYRGQTDNNPRPGESRSSRGSFFFGGSRDRDRNVNASGEARPVTMYISADERTNTLYINSNEMVFKEVQTLAKQMDEAAKTTKRVVEIVPTDGIDPALIQQVIDALQGRSTGASTSSSSLVVPSSRDTGGRGGDRGGRGALVGRSPRPDPRVGFFSTRGQG